MKVLGKILLQVLKTAQCRYVGVLLIVLSIFAGAARGQTPGTGSLTFSADTAPDGIGGIDLSVNGVLSCEVFYSIGDLPWDIANRMAVAINGGCTTFVSASVDPGLRGASIVPMVMTAKTSGANTNYSFSAAYRPGDVPFFTLTPSGPTLTGGTDAPPPPPGGSILPKYMVVAVTFAPPGSQSSVSYSNSTMVGTSTTLNSSFTNSTNVTVTVGLGTDSLFGLTPDGKVDFFSSNTFTEESDTSSSLAINQTRQQSTTVRGPLDDAAGLDHDADVIWLWLNPVVNMTTPTSSNLNWTGFLFDERDPVGEMDVFPVQVKYLNGHAPVPSNIAQVLARTWAPNLEDGSAPGLTGPGPGTDFEKILTADPFTNPAYTVTVPQGSRCTTDQRFCLTGNQNLTYAPPPPGIPPITQSLTLTKETIATQGQGAKDTRDVNFGVDINASGGFLVNFHAELKVQHTFTWVNQYSTVNTQNAGQTATASITGPVASANYSGPVEFDVFQDTIYGTFMFFPVNTGPDFSIQVVAPTSKTVNAGGTATYTVGTSALNGFAGTITLSTGPLPSGVSASFNPPTIVGSGSSTLTLTTSSSTPAASSPITITGTSGNITHSTSATLVVEDFSISATPASQTVNAGANTSYTVSTTALNGFSGNVTLSTGTLPAGVSASFAPNPIAAGASSTLTLSTTTAVLAGNYPITIFATSAGITHSAQVNLTVIAPDFAIAATPNSQSIIPGECTTYTVSTTVLNGFSGSIGLGQSGAPTGSSANFNPLTINGAGSSVLNVCTSTSTPAGSYTITITGVNGSIVHSTAVILVVQDFTVSATPGSQTITAGGNTSYTVSITALDGFSRNVALSTSGLPANASASFVPTSITGAGSSVMTVTTTTAVVPGTYTLTISGATPITGTSNNLIRSTTVTLVVNAVPAPNFTISAAPASLTIARGGNGTYTVTISAVNGFTGAVNLTVTGLPARTTATFTPTSVTGSGTSSLRITVQSNATRGTSTLTIHGVSGALSHTTPVTLIIN